MKLKISTMLFVVAFAAPVAFAGEQTGKISKIIVRASDNLHYFILEGASTNKPVCASGSYWIIKDENSAAGKTQISMLLSAHAQQKTIQVKGSGSCSRWPDGEDVNSVTLQ